MTARNTKSAPARSVPQAALAYANRMRRIPPARTCERIPNSLFRSKNSLFRAEQGIRQTPLAGNDKKGLARLENGSDQGNVENLRNILFPTPLQRRSRRARSTRGSRIWKAVDLAHVETESIPYGAAATGPLPGRVRSSQSAMTLAMASLFFSSIIMWPLPRMPASCSRTKVLFTPAWASQRTVQWS
jgi:hypothetical protein